MNKDDFAIKSQISSNIQNSEYLISTGVFSANALRPFQEPTFISIILKVNDLLQKLNALGKRISFNEDIEDGDITDLLSRTRNAVCHLSSGENILDKETQTKFVFSMIIGKGTAMAIEGKSLATSDYEDDIAFYYGDNRLYLKRHLIKILQEARVIFRELYPNEIL